MHRLIIVDDDPMLLSALRRGMRKFFDVETYSDASAALSFLASGGRADAVLSDVTMCPMDGKAFRAALLAARPDLEGRVFMMSGGATEPSLADFLRTTPHFRKPFDLNAAAGAIGRSVPG